MKSKVAVIAAVRLFSTQQTAIAHCAVVGVVAAVDDTCQVHLHHENPYAMGAFVV